MYSERLLKPRAGEYQHGRVRSEFDVAFTSTVGLQCGLAAHSPLTHSLIVYMACMGVIIVWARQEKAIGLCSYDMLCYVM